MLFSLVIFTDNVLHVCKSQDVRQQSDGRATALYSGSRFECAVIATGSREDMENQKRHILTGTVDCSDYFASKGRREPSPKCKRVLHFDGQVRKSQLSRPSGSAATTSLLTEIQKENVLDETSSVLPEAAPKCKPILHIDGSSRSQLSRPSGSTATTDSSTEIQKENVLDETSSVLPEAAPKCKPILHIDGSSRSQLSRSSGSAATTDASTEIQKENVFDETSSVLPEAAPKCKPILHIDGSSRSQLSRPSGSASTADASTEIQKENVLDETSSVLPEAAPKCKPILHIDGSSRSQLYRPSGSAATTDASTEIQKENVLDETSSSVLEASIVSLKCQSVLNTDGSPRRSQPSQPSGLAEITDSSTEIQKENVLIETTSVPKGALANQSNPEYLDLLKAAGNELQDCYKLLIELGQNVDPLPRFITEIFSQPKDTDDIGNLSDDSEISIHAFTSRENKSTLEFAANLEENQSNEVIEHICPDENVAQDSEESSLKKTPPRRDNNEGEHPDQYHRTAGKINDACETVNTDDLFEDEISFPVLASRVDKSTVESAANLEEQSNEVDEHLCIDENVAQNNEESPLKKMPPRRDKGGEGKYQYHETAGKINDVTNLEENQANEEFFADGKNDWEKNEKSSLVQYRSTAALKNQIKDLVTLAIAIIQEGEVFFTICAPLHKGYYTAQLQNYHRHSVATLKAENENKECPEKYCGDSFNNSAVPCILTIQNDRLDCSASCCIPAGVLRSMGGETSLTGVRVIPLFKESALAKVTPTTDQTNTCAFKEKVTVNRKHFCLFCNKLVTCFGTHIRHVHGKEPEVIELCKMPPNSDERNDALKMLRLTGDKIHNLECKPEERILVRKIKEPSKSVSCGHCGGMFSKKNFSRHDIRCSSRDADGRRAIKQADLPFKIEQRLTAPNSRENIRTRATENFLDIMRDDDVSRTIKTDLLLYDFAADLAQKYCDNFMEARNARQFLRLAARLLRTLNGINSNVQEAADIFDIQYYDDIIFSIRRLCKLDDKPIVKRCPSIAIHFGLVLKKLGQFQRLKCIKKGRNCHADMIQKVMDFLEYHQNKFNALISKQARKVLIERNVYHKKIELPSTDDTVAYGSYIRTESRKAYYRLLENGYDFQNWKLLGETVMLQMMFLNRRRVGEISRVLLMAFEGRCQVGEDDRKHLDAAQTILANSLQVMKIIGKRQRILPILLTSLNIKEIQLFIKMRRVAYVSDDNKYLFAVPRTQNHFDASAVIRNISTRCGAKKPETLRGTLLRKQVATLTQLISMDENDMQQLADFMGHDIDVHKSVYRTPSELLQITRLSKVFMAMSSGDLLKYKGKTIDEIEHQLTNEIALIDNQIVEHDLYDWESDSEETEASGSASLVDTPQKASRTPKKTVKRLLYETRLPKKHRSKILMKSPKVTGTGESRPFCDIGTPEPKPSKQVFCTPSPKKSSEKIVTPSSSIRSGSVFSVSALSPSSTSDYSFVSKTSLRSHRLKKSKTLMADVLHDIENGQRRTKLMWTKQEKQLIKTNFPECFGSIAINPSMNKCADIARKYKNELRGRRERVLYVWIRAEQQRLFNQRKKSVF